MLGKVFKVTARNFQSWKALDLSVKGFTVIVGPSDRGKSAIIRALCGILRNEVGANHISWWSKETSVTLEPEGQETIELTRNAKTVNYKIGDEEFSKLNGGLPPVIADMRCNEVDINGVKLDPVFADQFDDQFMLKMSPSELNSIFGLFSSTEKLNAGKKAAAAKNVEFNSNAKFLAIEIQEAESKVEEIRIIADEFSELEEDVDAISENIARYDSKIQELKALASSREFVGVLTTVISIPIPSTAKAEKVLAIGKQLSAYRKRKEFVSTLAQATRLPIGKADTLIAQSKAVNSISSLIAAKSKVSAMSGLTTVVVDKVEPLIKQAKTIADIRAYIALKLKVTSLTIPDLSIGSWNTLEVAIEDASSKIKLINRYNKAVKEVARIKSELKTIKNEYKTVSEGISELKTDGVECPECGHFFQLGEEHGTH
jgi:prefoldin subunit 5